MRNAVTDMMGDDPAQSFLRDDLGVMNYLRKFATHRPRRMRPAANDNHPDRVTYMVPFNGGCSTTSGRVPVTLRRLACVDGVAA